MKVSHLNTEVTNINIWIPFFSLKILFIFLKWFTSGPHIASKGFQSGFENSHIF